MHDTFLTYFIQFFKNILNTIYLQIYNTPHHHIPRIENRVSIVVTEHWVSEI